MIEKFADTEYTVHDFIRGRWSPLAFSNRTVELEKLLILNGATCRSGGFRPWLDYTSFRLAAGGTERFALKAGSPSSDSPPAPPAFSVDGN